METIALLGLVAVFSAFMHGHTRLNAPTPDPEP